MIDGTTSGRTRRPRLPVADRSDGWQQVGSLGRPGATGDRRKVGIGGQRLQQILDARAITFQRTETSKESPDPLREQKPARIEWLLEHSVTARVPTVRGLVLDRHRPARP
jgi:hypothetical protein